MVRADCAGAANNCPTGGIRLHFTNPVKGSEIQRHITVLPRAEFTISDTAQESSDWYLETQLATHTAYAVIADTGIRDVFGQRLSGNPAAGFRTTGYAPLVEHEYGRMTVERAGFGTLAVKHVNVDTLTITIAPVPDALIPAHPAVQPVESGGQRAGQGAQGRGYPERCRARPSRPGPDLRREAAGLQCAAHRLAGTAGGQGHQSDPLPRMAAEPAVCDRAGDRPRGAREDRRLPRAWSGSPG